MKKKNNVKRKAASKPSLVPVQYDSVQKLIFKIEREAKSVEKKWYQKVFRLGHLSEEDFAKWGKKYGLEREAEVAYLFSRDPGVFAYDSDWFPYLQNFYITLAERELEARKKGIKIDDPFMRIYETLRTNEIKNYEFKERYYRYYKRANLIVKDLFIYVSSEDVKIIRQYIVESPSSFADSNVWFDAFQRLYISVVRSLQEIRQYQKLVESPLKLEKRDKSPTGQPVDERWEKSFNQFGKFLRDSAIDAISKDIVVEQLNALLANPPFEIPEVAPELYKNRAIQDEDAYAFLKRVYGKYLDAGILYQYQLRKLDPFLAVAVDNYCKYRKIKFSSILPPKSLAIEREINSVDAKEIKRIARNLTRR
jgi:hypothetical protein